MELDQLPKDLERMILLRLPVKSLVKCTSVSKTWASMISDKEFRELHLKQSKTRPRLLFMVPEPYSSNVWFHSVYQQQEAENPLLISQQQICILSKPNYTVSQTIRGLVCLNSGTKVEIFNPATKKSVPLPDIQASSSSSSETECLFGYDEVADVFKVLCMTKRLDDDQVQVATREHQVITLGEQQWRPVECEHDHFPSKASKLCKGGVLYYLAWFEAYKPFIMSFNLTSEEFSVIEIAVISSTPLYVIDNKWKLVNYKGEIALMASLPRFAIDLTEDREIKIWVRSENSGEWRVESVVIHGWRETVKSCMRTPYLRVDPLFKGITETGEFVFALNILVDGSIFVMYYDTTTQRLRRFHVQGVYGDQYFGVITLLNHVDSLLLYS